ncbi:phospholipase D-like domain-containing protein [Flavivirga sp. 57AJ16]|uniref:phospholipase D-like domain-containing protein n=1 Tax=Flavivirga sp. 57AJ16 TaxID=3025307 RepID=UPI002366F5B9|nr:phospholipase D-like domain-containing protein [Flavivirga sp. 57AJ16]MDD7886839.1 phospholipase D-like domain-containing protein [Flavivirga sp. 57AJ16]
MFYNGANCDIYIGKGAGKKLLNDIRNAKKSIKIVSPYLSPFLITELINFRKRNLEVQLITTDNIEDFYGSYEKNIHKLIIQNKKIDKEAVEKREKWKDLIKILTYIGFGLLVILIGIIYYLKDVKLILGLTPIIILFLIIKLYKNKINNKRIYSYWYSQLFPFKVYMSPDTTDESDTFIHSKIYLIDDQIAYLGSLNFTSSGTKHNYETRIRTNDLNAIKEIKDEIYQLMNHSYLPERDIQLWGKQLYQEPIN